MFYVLGANWGGDNKGAWKCSSTEQIGTSKRLPLRPLLDRQRCHVGSAQQTCGTLHYECLTKREVNVSTETRWNLQAGLLLGRVWVPKLGSESRPKFRPTSLETDSPSQLFVPKFGAGI